MNAPMLIRTSEEITGEWLGDVLGVDGLAVESIERIGAGQMSDSFRVAYSGGPEGDGSVVVKLAASDETSRGTGVTLGVYLREVTFYRELRDRIGGPLAVCHLAGYDDAEGWFTLVLEDITDGVQGDQIEGCTPEQARAAMLALARIHAPVMGDLALAAEGWLNQVNPLNQALMTALLPQFLERYSDRIAPEHAEVCERLVEVLDAWESDRRPPMGLVHGDYRLDNMLFHGEEVTVVDWQTLSIGPAMRDAAYFLTGGLKVEDRREHEESLVRAYHDELLAQGVKNFDWETCWEEYRRQPFLGLIMAIAPAMIVQRTDRGDDMFMAVVERTAQAILDLGSLELLPAPGTSSALRPDPGDEGTHETGPEDLWNESWYFDAIADDGSLGVYYRLGRLPNWDDEGACMLAVCIVRPGEPAIMLVEETPLPDDAGPDQEVRGESGHSEQICEEPLQRFRVRVEGTAGAHADHSAPLRGEAGEPVEIAFDLVWETDGIPYQWRLSTRYEIPCRVSGTVTVGGESFELSGPGQRDHSWGGRDWWASDWMWSALHLADGTHTHAVTVPTHPDFGVGYVQRGEELRELGAVTSSAIESADGLTESAAIGMPPGELDVELEPLAFGAMLLEAPDGRVSHFPRAMCRVRTAEGVEGLGWVEWNRNQR